MFIIVRLHQTSFLCPTSLTQSHIVEINSDAFQPSLTPSSQILRNAL